jgi:hypothetical protein
MSFREIWNGPSFLNRSETARRMTARDECGKKKNQPRLKPGSRHEHFDKHWDKDLWE